MPVLDGPDLGGGQPSKVAARVSEAGNAVTLRGPRMPLGPSAHRTAGPGCPGTHRLEVVDGQGDLLPEGQLGQQPVGALAGGAHRG